MYFKQSSFSLSANGVKTKIPKKQFSVHILTLMIVFEMTSHQFIHFNYIGASERPKYMRSF